MTANVRVDLGRGHALRRVAGSLLLNQVLMKLIARHEAAGGPQLAVYAHDLIGQAINVYGWWEREELLVLRRFIERHLGRGGAMLDVGANIGNHTLFLRDLFDEIHAIEANPRTLRLLQLNVEDQPHVTAHGFAASDREGTLEFVVERRNAGASHVAADGERGRRIAVPARRIDDAIAPGRPLRFVKLDVEGHEAACLRGMAGLIRRHRPCIVFEQHASDFVGASSPTIDELRRLGYSRFHHVTRVPSARGGGLARRVGANLQALLRGLRIEAVETRVFEPRFYEAIIASAPD